MQIDEELKTHIVEGERCPSDTPSDTSFFTSLFRRSISESVNPSDSYPETPTSSAQPTTSTSSSSSSTSASVLAPVSHTPPTSVGPSEHPTGLSSPLSLRAKFSSGTSKGEGETAAPTNDFLSAWDRQISSSKMTLYSDILRNSIRRTWLVA